MLKIAPISPEKTKAPGSAPVRRLTAVPPSEWKPVGAALPGPEPRGIAALLETIDSLRADVARLQKENDDLWRKAFDLRGITHAERLAQDKGIVAEIRAQVAQQFNLDPADLVHRMGGQKPKVPPEARRAVIIEAYRIFQSVERVKMAVGCGKDTAVDALMGADVEVRRRGKRSVAGFSGRLSGRAA